jgi:hypothetical protein
VVDHAGYFIVMVGKYGDVIKGILPNKLNGGNMEAMTILFLL